MKRIPSQKLPPEISKLARKEGGTSYVNSLQETYIFNIARITSFTSKAIKVVFDDQKKAFSSEEIEHLIKTLNETEIVQDTMQDEDIQEYGKHLIEYIIAKRKDNARTMELLVEFQRISFCETLSVSNFVEYLTEFLPHGKESILHTLSDVEFDILQQEFAQYVIKAISNNK